MRLELAACLDVEPELFFPEPGGDAAAKVTEAKVVCADCPIRQECLSVALERRERFGVWGGLTASERREIPTQRHCTWAECTEPILGLRRYCPEHAKKARARSHAASDRRRRLRDSSAASATTITAKAS